MIRAALVALALVACAPPPPRPAIWYDAANDVFHYDDAIIEQVAQWYGQPGVDWLNAHDEGHQHMMRVWRNEQRALWLDMPGDTANIQIEQYAQCWATAQLGPAPWHYDEAGVAAGYWACPDEYVAIVEAAA